MSVTSYNMPIPINIFHIPTLLKEIPFSDAMSCLDDSEKFSVSSIKAERRLHEFVYGRHLLKQALANHLNCPVSSIQLLKHEHGKLYLQGQPTNFNLTHSGDYLAFAICDAGEIGVDIEHPQRKVNDYMAIAERFFTVEESQLLTNTPEAQQMATFYKIWTLKEAALKTVGIGISAGLDRLNASNMDMQKLHTLSLAGSTHSLWFDHWSNPLAYDNVYLSVAIEPATPNLAKPQFFPI